MSDEIKFDELTNELQDRIIFAAQEIISAMHDAYGPERGHEIWDKLSDTLGRDVKYGVFTADAFNLLHNIINGHARS